MGFTCKYTHQDSYEHEKRDCAQTSAMAIQVILAILASWGGNQAMKFTGSTATISGISYVMNPFFVLTSKDLHLIRPVTFHHPLPPKFERKHAHNVLKWIPPDCVGAISNSPAVQKLREFVAGAGVFLPLTVVHSDFGSNVSETASQTFARYSNKDDVWQDGFSKGTGSFHDLNKLLINMSLFQSSTCRQRQAKTPRFRLPCLSKT